MAPISMEGIKRLDAPFLSRNPKISYVFERLGLSENRGLGFRTIRELPTEYNLPLPTVAFDDTYLIFTFSRDYGNGNGHKQSSELSSSEVKGLDYIKLESPITRKDYEEHMGLSQKTAERHLAHFVKLNVIRRVGSGPKITYEIAD